jgi:glutathione S-transferase
MKLIGMLDSPYVRRVAISLQLLGLPFEHRSLSVFRTYDEFRRINPVVKAPTLVCDDGTVLMDSTLILQYAEALARRSLHPSEPQALQQALRVTGLALAACEKSVQIYYEHTLRPEEKRHAPWLERVTAQLHEAYGALESELAERPIEATAARIGLGGVTTAVTWRFTEQTVPGIVRPERHPELARFSRQAEALAEFAAAPHGAGTFGIPGATGS